jgi:aldose 1-epimerase
VANETRFVIEERPTPVRGEPGLLLRDRESGAAALVTPGQGANVVALRLAARGAALNLLIDEPARDELVSFGSPVLFPYPNRVRDAAYTWAGRTYRLPPLPGSAHAIHGLVRERPFTVEARDTGDESATLTLAIRGRDLPELADAYPFAFGLRITYTLTAGRLTTSASVWNEGDVPMPFGLGFHPFFRAPLAPDGRRDDCMVQAWGPRVWETGDDGLPTGRILPVPPAADARGYPRLAGRALGTIYTGLALDDPGAGTWSSRYLDPAAGVEVVVVAAAAFREVILFAPTTRPTVSIEPYTCTTDALNLQARGHDAGLLVLPPGERWAADYSISVRAITFAPA